MAISVQQQMSCARLQLTDKSFKAALGDNVNLKIFL